MFRRSFPPGSRRRLLLAIAVLAAVVLWWGRSRQHDLDNRLIRAVRDGEMTSVESRLREGANPNALEDQQPSTLSFWHRVLLLFRDRPPRLSVLELALADRRWLVAERLVEAGATVPPERMEVAFTRAAAGGKEAVVEHLMQEGAKINDPDSMGCAPLWHAVDSGHPKIVEKLLAHGAKISTVTSDTAKQLPGFSPRCALTGLTWNAIPLERRTLVLTMLLGKGLNTDTRLETGRTMLMDALIRHDIPFASFLIEQGADLDLQDGSGNTARFYAKRLVVEARGRVPPEFVELIEGREP